MKYKVITNVLKLINGFWSYQNDKAKVTVELTCLHCSHSALLLWIMIHSCSTSWGALSKKVSSSRSMLTSAYSYIMAQ